MGGRVLMVARQFPPSGAVAAQRPSKFARYLPEFGWEPFVVCGGPDRLQPLDRSLEGRPAPGARIGAFEPARLLRSSLLQKLLLVPDPEVGWMTALAVRLPALVARFQPDILWANSVPTGSLVAAAWTARRLGIPFMADFHNEWTRNMYYRPATPFHDRLHRALEAYVIRSARLVTTLNPLHTEDLRARFPGAEVETIENGFDPEDRPVAPPARGARRVFVYAGAVYGWQTPIPFLKALRESGLKDVEVHVAGDRFGGFAGGDWPFPIRISSHVPYAELPRVFAEASAFFLCLEPPAARQLPAKLYEYLGAGRPTFAIAPRDGAVDRWLRKTPAGVCVPSEEPGAWVPALRRFVDGLDAYRPPPAAEFTRRALTAQLAAALERTAKAERAVTHAPQRTEGGR